MCVIYFTRAHTGHIKNALTIIIIIKINREPTKTLASRQANIGNFERYERASHFMVIGL